MSYFDLMVTSEKPQKNRGIRRFPLFIIIPPRDPVDFLYS